MNVHFNNIIHSQSSAISGLQVLVFKTNLRLKRDLRLISPVLNAATGILRWNVDQHDIDNVLRVETHRLQEQEIIVLVTGAGYYCEQLPD
jgi:hypothetical protein